LVSDSESALPQGLAVFAGDAIGSTAAMLAAEKWSLGQHH